MVRFIDFDTILFLVRRTKCHLYLHFQKVLYLQTVYISEMRYYVHYLHFSDYCPHLCRHVYYNVSAVVHSGLLVAEDIRFIIPRNSYTDVLYQALVRSSDIPKECEFNTRWWHLRIFRGEIEQEITDNWHPLNIARGTRTVYPGKRNKGLSSTFQPPEEGRCVQGPKRRDKYGDKDDDNSLKNVNNVLYLHWRNII